jgi:hypothetical protein
LLLFVLTATANAHIGSPDTFVQAAVGPYSVLIAAHPPATAPGVLELDLRFNPDDRLTAATASIDGAPPVPLQLVLDGTASTGLWLSTTTAHTLRIAVQGGRGPGTYTVTLPASAPPTSAKPRQPLLTLRFLFPFSLLLLAAVLLFFTPKQNLLHPYRRQLSAAILLAAVLLVWLTPRPAPNTSLAASLTSNGHLAFTLSNPSESFDNLAPDHGKLMHAFLLREPAHDVFEHLHPVQISPGHFDMALPAMPPGTYTLFADFYHANGTGETASLRLTLPQQSRSATQDPDDSSAVIRTTPISAIDLSSRPDPEQANRVEGEAERPASAPATTTLTYALPSGYTLTLLTPTRLAPLHANLFTVTLLDPAGQPPSDMALYLGMSAHAVVLRSDDSVFAHIHPGGTLPMLTSTNAPMEMSMPMPAPSNTANIPYGFPASGLYRLFVQMKHGPIVETAAFDLNVN